VGGQAVTAATSKMSTRILIAADLHIPLHNQDATDELLKRIRALHPDVVCLAGDVLDFDSLSNFLSDPDGAKLQQELDQAREFLKRFRKAVGRARWDLCLGNHEDRLRQFLWKNPAIAGLAALQLHNLLGVPADRIHPYGEPVKYGTICCYHTETQGKCNGNTQRRALDRVTRTGAQVVVTAHLHVASTVYTHDRQGLGCSVVTPCLQGQADWTRPAPAWDTGHVEIVVDTGKFPKVTQVLY
jgi:predicted phosphodiesterase